MDLLPDIESYPSGDGEPELEGFWDDYKDNLLDSDVLLAWLTIVGEKNGSDIEAYFPTEEELEAFIERLNSMGVNCFVYRNVDYTQVDNLLAIFGEEDEDIDQLEEMGSMPVKVQLFITRDDSYSARYFRELYLWQKVYPPRYHRKFGEFLGLQEENIEAYCSRERSFISRAVKRLLGTSTPEPLIDDKALEKYGGELTEEEKTAFRVFSFGLVTDREEVFQETLERAKRRKERLEEYSIDLEEMIDTMDF